MKIRLALIDSNDKYATRLLHYYANHYEDKLELSYFTSFEKFKENLLSKNMDVLLISEQCDGDLTSLQGKMLTAYLTESLSIDSIHGIKAICKYQKPDLIYKELLRMFAEYDSDSVTYRLGDLNKTAVDIFMPVSGGAGCSSLAAAHAGRITEKGGKVLYLNTEKLPSTACFFSGEGSGTFQDVIYAVKSRRPNLALKLESMVRQDESGVYFFEPSPNVLDMNELNAEETEQLLKELLAIGNYDRIVIDADLNLEAHLKVYTKYAYRFVLVTEQSEMGMKKMEQLSQALMLMEQGKQIDISTKLNVICNKSDPHRETAYAGQIPIGEFVPVFPGNSMKQVQEQMRRYPILQAAWKRQN